jgi:ribonuclease HII
VLLSYHQKKIAFEAGCDEAGRGCLAGPVFAAAVILPVKFRHKLLNDSKQMKAADRDTLRVVIEKEAICYAVASVDNEEIDRINILQASFRAMHLALEKLQQTPGYILVDGNRFIPYGDIPHACIINAIRQHGDTPYHRKTFRLLPAQIEMDFANEPVE